ncbi:hypothetical protein VTK26DRAFT_9292 [Humicola hyalothermophila]
MQVTVGAAVNCISTIHMAQLAKSFDQMALKFIKAILLSRLARLCVGIVSKLGPMGFWMDRGYPQCMQLRVGTAWLPHPKSEKSSTTPLSPGEARLG